MIKLIQERSGISRNMALFINAKKVQVLVNPISSAGLLSSLKTCAAMATLQFDILAIIAALNEQEALTGSLIRDFAAKINDFFDYVSHSNEGSRLIVKMRSHVSEAEIYDNFAIIYRQYRALYRLRVGDYFFKEMDDLVDKLCDDFEKHVMG